MAGRVQWEAQVDSNVAKLLSETKDLRDQLDGIKKGNYEIKLNIDNEKLEKVISNLDKMLNSLGKGTGDFKEFENLSKQLNEIVSEVKELNKAFGGINNSGVSNLLSSIQSIDKSLSSLSEHIANVNKDFGNVGKNASDNVGRINETKKATEGLTEATKELANAQKNVGNKSNISSGKVNSLKDDILKLENEIKSDTGTGILQSILFGKDGHIKMPSTILNEIDDIQKQIDARLSKNVNANITDLIDNKSKLIVASTLNGLLSYDDVKKYVPHPDTIYDEANRLGLSDISSQYKNLDDTVESLSALVSKVKELNALQSTSVSDNSIVKNQDKIQEKLIETREQAEKAEQAIKSQSSTTIKDTFQGDVKASSESTTSAIKDEAKAMEQVAENAEKASKEKGKFAKANKDVKASADSSSGSIEKENSALDASVWKKNLKAIQEYMDANTKLNNLMAKDKGTGKHASDIARQEKEVEKLKESAIEARTVLSSMVNPHEAPIQDWGKWVESMEKFEQATKGSTESVAKLEDALRSVRNAQLNSIDSTISNGQSKLDDFSARKAQSDAYKNSLKELNETLENLRALRASLSNTRTFTNEEQTQIEALTKSVRDYVKEISRMSADEKGSNDISRFKLLDRIAEYMKKNTRMSREFKAELESLMDTLRTGGASVQTGDILTQFEKIKDKIRQAKQEGISFFDIFNSKVVYGTAARLAQYYLSFYDFIRYARYAVNAVRDIDTALTELRKVSDATEKRLTQNIKNSTVTAKELGAAISDVVSATADWAKMGYNVDDAEELARVSVLYKNVGDGIEIDDANSSLISTLQGFQLDASEAEGIIDKFNEVANNYAIDSAGIGEALKRSAASFNAANTDLSKSIALITATRLQNWLNAWKHVLRIYLIAIEVFITMHHNIEETTI